MFKSVNQPELPVLPDCTVDNLRQLAARGGIDCATTLVYNQVRHSPAHGPFIRQIESLAITTAPLPRLNATLVIVPGAFYRQFPQSGADGHVVRQVAEKFGCPVETIPLPNLGSLSANARQICDSLERRDDAPIILVSLSKGGSDVKCALALPGAERAFRNVTFWFNLSGILNGTPLVGWLFSNTFRSRWTRFLLRCRGYDLALIRELNRYPGAPLDFELRLPAHLQVIHLVGFPLRQHATNRLARRNHMRLEPQGPNDGAGILLGDAVHWPGLLYPVWGADHYLRPTTHDMNRITTALLRYTAQEIMAEVPA